MGTPEATVKGLTRESPLSHSVRRPCSNWSRPPTVLPRRTPTLSSSAKGSESPASARASWAVAMASCEQRAIRRASLKLMYCLGSKPFISPAIREGKELASNWVTGPTPDLPATNPSHVSFTVKPRGVMAPMPVTTTLSLMLRCLAMLLSFRYTLPAIPSLIASSIPFSTASLLTRTMFLMALALERPWPTMTTPFTPSRGAPPYSV